MTTVIRQGKSFMSAYSASVVSDADIALMYAFFSANTTPPTSTSPTSAPPKVTPTPSNQACGSGSAQRLWLLDADQYAKTIAVALSGRSSSANEDRVLSNTTVNLPLKSLGGTGATFSTRSKDRHVLPGDAEDIAKAANAVADLLIKDSAIAACVAGSGALRACLQAPLLQKAELLFRRPVVAADVEHYLSAAEKVVALCR